MAVAPVIVDNPYQELLHAELAKHGVRFEIPRRLSLRWALRSPLDVLHLHWVEYLTGSHLSERLHGVRTLLRTARLLAVIALVKARRARLVWSVHNLQPHDARHPRFDLAVSRCVARMADHVIAHSEHAAELVRAEYRVDDVTVAYHGTLEGQFSAASVDRNTVRRRLGVPETAHVFLTFGLIRAYKQVPELIQAFGQLPDPDLRLIVAGRPLPPAVGEAVRARRRATAGDPAARSRARRGGQRALHLAADAAVLPYRDVFSSSALLLALSLGVPVVAPADTTADEMAPPPAVVPYRDGGLPAALAKTRQEDQAVAGAAALSAARRYPWSDTAARVLGCYR